MNLLSLISIGNDELKNHNLEGWIFRLDNVLKTNAGECDLVNKIISINSYWAKNVSAEKVLQVLEEEISHAINCSICEKRFSCGENYHCEKIKGKGVI